MHLNVGISGQLIATKRIDDQIQLSFANKEGKIYQISLGKWTEKFAEKGLTTDDQWKALIGATVTFRVKQTFWTLNPFPDTL